MEDVEGEEMAEKLGDLLIAAGGDYEVIKPDGTKSTKNYRGGKHYGINTVTHYEDGYVDVLFTDDVILPKVKLEDLGYYLGSPKIIEVEEKKPEPKKPRSVFPSFTKKDDESVDE